jgi:hypothetical protein
MTTHTPNTSMQLQQPRRTPSRHGQHHTHTHTHTHASTHTCTHTHTHTHKHTNHISLPPPCPQVEHPLNALSVDGRPIKVHKTSIDHHAAINRSDGLIPVSLFARHQHLMPEHWCLRKARKLRIVSLTHALSGSHCLCHRSFFLRTNSATAYALQQRSTFWA